MRKLGRNGITQSVAMAITGHKTASVYRGHRIVNEEDIRVRGALCGYSRPLRSQCMIADTDGRRGRLVTGTFHLLELNGGLDWT